MSVPVIASWAAAVLLLLPSSGWAQAEELAIKISGPVHILIGETPTLRAEVTNRSAADVEFVRPLDGSWHHRRYPFLSAIIENPQGHKQPLRPGGRCGNMNSLAVENLVHLAPGQSTLLSMEVPFYPFDSLGTYRVTLSYDLASPELGRWGVYLEGDAAGKLLGKATPREAIDRLGQFPKTTLTAEVEIVVHSAEPERLARALIEFYQNEDATEFAFVDKAYREGRWRVNDIRYGNDRITGRVDFAKGFKLPPRPKYITAGYWFERGRYMFGRSAAGGRVLVRLIDRADAATYEILRPGEASQTAKMYMPELRKQLGF